MASEPTIAHQMARPSCASNPAPAASDINVTEKMTNTSLKLACRGAASEFADCRVITAEPPPRIV